MKKACLIILTLLVLGLLFQPVYAQEGDYRLHLRRDFGYGSGSNIRGTFTASLVGDETRVDTVTFLIDGIVMAVVDRAPFKHQFHTDDYGFGLHRLTAKVRFADGSAQTTSALQYNFVSPGEEREQVTIVLVGIGGAILITLALVALVQMLMMRNKPHSSGANGGPRNYGLLGATICPKCGRPYPRHIWGMNLVVGRLDRCNHCGKWAMTVRATPQALQLAEALEDEASPDAVEGLGHPNEDQKILEDTRYVDDI